MLYLELPATETEDDNVVKTICKDPDWEDHLEDWLAAYSAYRECGGNPWLVEPVHFDGPVREKMYALYTSKRKSAALSAIRDTQLSSCPMCGSLSTGDLDHHLPREIFSEFSIMRANLIPACTHCNSGSKGMTYRGDDPERFIHPYFDAWAADPLWLVEIQPPYEAASFQACPLPGLDPDRRTIVQFHLNNVLGKQFSRSMRSLWGSYPRSLSIVLTAYDIESVASEIEKDLRRTVVSRGANAWDTAFFRGLLANPDAIENIRSRIEEFVAV